MPVLLLATIMHVIGLLYEPPAATQPEAVQLAVAHSLITYPRIIQINGIPPVAISFLSKPTVFITAQAGVLVDASSGQTLWQKNIDQPRPLASLTKLITALVFLDTQPDWTRQVAIEQSDIDSTTGNTLILKAGELASVRDIFMASLVASANNATEALARSTGISKQDFIQRMNDKAKTLQMTHSRFSDVTGLDPANVSTARDYVRLAQEAFSQPDIKQAVTTREYSFTTSGIKVTHHLTNTDQLLVDSSVTVKAAKTGFIDESGYNFASLDSVSGHDVLLITFGGESSQARFEEAKALLQWAGRTFRWLETTK